MSRADKTKVDVWLDEEYGQVLASVQEGPHVGMDLDTGLDENTLSTQVPLRFRRRLADGKVVTWFAPSSLVAGWLKRTGQGDGDG